jgi:hypothetical protein
MFQLSVLRPQWTTFRSPEVARFPFVGGSMQTVMTPPWMPGLTLPLADASETTVPATTTPTTSFHANAGDLPILAPPPWLLERNRPLRDDVRRSRPR